MVSSKPSPIQQLTVTEQQPAEVAKSSQHGSHALFSVDNRPEPCDSSNNGDCSSAQDTLTPHHVAARLPKPQDRQQQVRQQHKQQLGTLPQMLAALQQEHLGQDFPMTQGQLAASQGSRLDRKLTAILTDSCSSWQDVAHVLFVADSIGRLNGLHIAAALATLEHSAAAGRVASASSEGISAAGGVMAGIVPVSRQQAQQLKFIRRAAAAALTMGFSSRWNIALLQLDSTQLAAATNDDSNSIVVDDVINWSSAATATMPQVDDWDQQQQLLDELCAAVADFWPSMSYATMVSCCWSLTRLGQVLPQPVLPLVGQTLLGMAQQLNSDNSNNSSSEEGHTNMEQYDTSEVLSRQTVVMCWSLAKMSLESQDLQQGHQHEQQHPAQQPIAQEVPELVGQVLGALIPHLPALSSQGLVMLWWTLATWQHNPAPGPATALLQVTAAAMAEQALIPRGLAVTMWAIARMRLCPDVSWLAAWLAATHAALPATNSHDTAVSVWALAKLGVPPPGEWLAAVCWRAAIVARRMAPQELPVLLWGLAKLGFKPSQQVMQLLLRRGLALAHTGQLSPQGLALTLWAVARLGIQPRGAWIDAVLAAAAAYLPLFRAVECSGLMAALVRLKHIPHQSWMVAWWRETRDKLSAADSQQLVQLLWCVVQLGQAPPAAWFAEWQQCIVQEMAVGSVTAQGYGLIWHALLQLEIAPSSTWLDAYWQASIQPGVLRDLDCRTAESTLAGLAALNQLGYSSSRPPSKWWMAFLPATQKKLSQAKLVNVCVMLQAAGQLQILLPRVWLNTAMDRVRALLQAEKLIPPAASGSTNSIITGNLSRRRGARAAAGANSTSMAHSRVDDSIAARLHRRCLAVRLKQALEGLRAQQMLARVAAAAGQHAAPKQQAGSTSLMGAMPGPHDVFDVLAVWPWLSDAVLATWPNRLSALQALRALSGSQQVGPAE